MKHRLHHTGIEVHLWELQEQEKRELAQITEGSYFQKASKKFKVKRKYARLREAAWHNSYMKDKLIDWGESNWN